MNRSTLPSYFLRATLLAACFLTTTRGQMFTGLGEFPVVEINATNSVKIAAVANDGTVVGTGYAGLFHSAFRWSQGSGFELLGSLPETSTSWANGISDDGKVIIGAIRSAGSIQATRWEGGGSVGLGSLPGYGSNATAISGDGLTIWGTSTTNSTEVASGPGWRMTGGGTLTSLGPDVSVPLDASGDGSVVVGAKLLSSLSGTPTRWDNSGHATLLEPPPDPQMGGAAYAVSSDGQTIAGANFGQAVTWDGSGQMTPLAPLNQKLLSHYATDVNADGSIIVGVAERVLNPDASTLDAFVWTPEIGMRRLINAISNDPLLKAGTAGWTLYEADGVSANSRYITGWGLDPNGNFQGWWLDRGEKPTAFTTFSPVPESNLYGVVAALALGATLLRRRAARKFWNADLH